MRERPLPDFASLHPDYDSRIPAYACKPSLSATVQVRQ